MGNDLRRVPRHKIYATAKIKTPMGNPGVITSRADNISEKGVKIETYTPMAIGSETSVELVFLTSDRKRETDTINGKIIWALKNNDIYSVGIEFTETVNAFSHAILYRYTRSSL